MFKLYNKVTLSFQLNKLVLSTEEMAALNELLKPRRFDADPNCPKAAKELKHWLNVFTDFLAKCTALAASQKV